MCVAPHLILLHFVCVCICFFYTSNFAGHHPKHIRTHAHTITFSVSSNRFLSWLNDCPVYYRRKWKQHPNKINKRTNKHMCVRCTHLSIEMFVPIEMSKSSQFLQATKSCDCVCSLVRSNVLSPQNVTIICVDVVSIPKGFQNSHGSQQTLIHSWT